MKALWDSLWRPSRLAAATLLIAGGLGGVVAFGAFGAFVEYSNTEEFCTSCHEMRGVHDEYRSSPHARNSSGVPAICSDCHVPRAWGEKLVRKVMATKELYHAFMGTIGTPEKFEANRLAMAQRVWRKMSHNGSLECRNCHDYGRMTLATQNEKARARHERAAGRDEPCVGCHKGIAHKRPDTVPAIAAARKALDEGAGPVGQGGSRAHPVGTAKLFGAAGGGDALGAVLAAAPLQVIERAEGWLKVRLEGWQEAGNESVVYAGEGQRVFRAGLKAGVARPTASMAPASASGAGGGWTRVAAEGWIENSGLVAEPAAIWAYAETLYDLKCGECHMPYPTDWYSVDQWAEQMKAMKPYAKLDQEDNRLLQIYLQTHAGPDQPADGRRQARDERPGSGS